MFLRSSPGSSIGVSAMKAACASRRSLSKTSERLLADRSLPDLLVTVEFRSARSFRVIAVPDLHVIQADRGIEMLQSFIESSLADDVVSGNVRVAGIDARANRNHSAQALQNLRHLLEAAAQREFRAGRVLDQDRESALGEIQSLRRGSNRRSRSQQSLLAVSPTK